MKYFCFFVVALFIHQSHGYKAAVVAYCPILKNTTRETIQENLKNYKHHVESLKGEGVDIIVFPEYGLTTAFIYPEKFAVEVTNDTPVIKELGALARENNMYIVVNLFEKVKETYKQIKYYNTNLVFDRKGHIIAKYHKIHLFGEDALTPGNEVVTFETDFGVKFGIFTCFDILFHTPSRSILEDGSVTDIIFPTAWTSSIPFFTSLSVQSGYATANRVNLLAASYIDLDWALDGSGIYLSNGKFSKMYLGEYCPLPRSKCSGSSSVSKSLVLSVPKTNRTTACSSSIIPQMSMSSNTINIVRYHKWKIFNASDYIFEDLDLRKTFVSSTVCHKEFCCTFNITIAQPANASEYYKLMVYDGKIDDKKTKFISRARICSLVACESYSKYSCGTAIHKTTVFTKIIIDSVLNKDNTTFFVPVTLNTNLIPIEDAIYCESSTTNQVHVQLSTSRSQKGVLSFGILGITDAASSADFVRLFVLIVLCNFIIC